MTPLSPEGERHLHVIFGMVSDREGNHKPPKLDLSGIDWEGWSMSEISDAVLAAIHVARPNMADPDASDLRDRVITRKLRAIAEGWGSQ